MNKVYIVGTAFGHAFRSMFRAKGWQIVDTPEDADFLQFTGGADISPNWYNQTAHPRTYVSLQRDKDEVSMYQEWETKKKMLGVCRGAQLLCAMAGGTLYQDVNNHGREHKVIDIATEREILVSSIHHQMMRPPANANVLAICNVATRKEFLSRSGDIITHENIKMGETYSGNADVEAAHFPNINALAFQPHPEFGPKSCTDYYFELIERMFG